MADDGAIVVCHSQRPAHHQSGGTIHQDDRRPDRLLSHRTLHHSSPFLLSHSPAPQSHIYNPLDQLQLHQSSSSTILMVLHQSSPFLVWHSEAPYIRSAESTVAPPKLTIYCNTLLQIHQCTPQSLHGVIKYNVFLLCVFFYHVSTISPWQSWVQLKLW